MAQAESILTLAYDFLLYLIPALSKLPRDHKFNLGDRIQNVAHDILDISSKRKKPQSCIAQQLH